MKNHILTPTSISQASFKSIMKDIILISFTSILLLSCDSLYEPGLLDCPCGPDESILIRKGCEAYVFQLIAPQVPVQSSWKDVFTKKTYENVISVLNYCDQSEESTLLQSLEVGTHVSMTLKSSDNHCLNLCFAFEDAPGASYEATNIMACIK